MPGHEPQTLSTGVIPAFEPSITGREGAVHRWVYGDPGATAEARVLSLSVRPRDGIVVLGRGLHEFLKREAGGKRFLENGGKRVAWPASGELEVTLLSPDRSTQARVVAAFDPKFDGGNHTSGAARARTGPPPVRDPDRRHPRRAGWSRGARQPRRPWGCSRARVVVRIPELDVDQVRRGRDQPFQGSRFSPGPGKMTHVLLFLGEQPADVLAQVVSVEADVSDAGASGRTTTGGHVTTGVTVKYNPEASFLGRRREGASVTLRFAREGVADEFLVLGSFDPTHVNVDVERLQAVGTYPSGAQATLARVWRGRTRSPRGKR